MRIDADRELFEQLPHSVRLRIYTEYLFDDFLEKFKFLFAIEKRKPINKSQQKVRRVGIRAVTYKDLFLQEKSAKNQGNFYSWDDPHYADFMSGFLNILEPRQFEPTEMITHTDKISCAFEMFLII